MDQPTLAYLGQRIDEARKLQAEIDHAREAIALAERSEFFVMRVLGHHFATHAGLDSIREELNLTVQSLLMVRVMQLESALAVL